MFVLKSKRKKSKIQRWKIFSAPLISTKLKEHSTLPLIETKVRVGSKVIEVKKFDQEDSNKFILSPNSQILLTVHWVGGRCDGVPVMDVWYLSKMRRITRWIWLFSLSRAKLVYYTFDSILMITNLV